MSKSNKIRIDINHIINEEDYDNLVKGEVITKCYDALHNNNFIFTKELIDRILNT